MQGTSFLEIAKMRSYGKYSKATEYRHMNMIIVDLAVDKWKGNQR